MPERRNLPPDLPQKPEGEAGSSRSNLAETRLISRPVGSLSLAELFELKQWLEACKVNISQSLLQKGQVSAGYAKRGVIELGGGRIAFVPYQHNERIEGTPEEFLRALKSLGLG